MSHCREAILRILKDGAELDSLTIADRVEEETNCDSLIGKIKHLSGYARSITYHELRTLERQGVLSCREGDELIPERGDRPRYYYKLTSEG